MSRIYKKPIIITKDIIVTINGSTVSISNTIFTITKHFNALVTIKQIEDTITVTPVNETKDAKMHTATVAMIIKNIVSGFTTPFTKSLKLVGVGYRANVEAEKIINLSVNFSHPVKYHLPETVTAASISPTELILKSPNKELLGKASSEIRAIRPPEAYKGKGIRYSNETIITKTPKKN